VLLHHNRVCLTLGSLLSGFDSLVGRRTGVSIDSSRLEPQLDGNAHGYSTHRFVGVGSFSVFVPILYFFSFLSEGTSGEDGYGLPIVNDMKDVMFFSRYLGESQVELNYA